jgi:hypothetical protein
MLGDKAMDSAGALSLRGMIPQFTVVAIATMLAGCGIGCLYGETGKVTVTRADSPPSPERVVEIVGDALRPMGFSGQVPYPIIPKPPWYWDYEFSVGVGKFAPRERVDVYIKFDDLSISLSDFAKNSKASAFDRSVTEAIKTRLRSELDADIAFTHPPTPAFCLGP